MSRSRKIVYHVLSWVVYLLMIGLGADELDADFIQKSISGTVTLILVFYINTELIFPYYLKRKKYVMLVFLLVFVCVAMVVLKWYINRFLPDVHQLFDSIFFWSYFRNNMLFVGISFAYWFSVKNYENEKYSRQLEKDVAEARLTALKNQINPHFLYNTLSLLYSKTLPLSVEVAELVGKLSDMMRYTLEEAEENGLVSLEKEVAHLKNFVDINQLRFGNKLKVIFEVTGRTEEHQIAPLLLITFVENAFKHGSLQDEAHPLEIRLDVNDKDLFFFVRNLKAGGVKDKSSGIGLTNVKNRLSILYPDRHSLKISDEADVYTVQLKILKDT